MSKILLKDIKQIKKLSKDQFESLYKISRTLNSAEFEESLIENVLDFIIKVINAERGLFAKYNKEENKFSIISARNIEKKSIKNLSEFSSGLLQKVIGMHESLVYHDVQSDPNVSQFESVQLQKIKSVIGVPIKKDGVIWGVILADSQKDRKEFTQENLIFLNFFSNLVSLALDKIINLEKLKDENIILSNQLEATEQMPAIIGESKPMRDLSKVIHKVAKSNATVLILGESGTGKDMVAQAIHKLSKRKDHPFIAQFCGSIPENLLESELFGYKKGAFTGAVSDKKGLLEVADKGTFFLDEIAEISNSVQAKLLRIIENRQIIRLGDTKVRKVNIRLLAATNKDLSKLVEKGKFREDLFYRLNVFPVRIPPLRERMEDISILTGYFLKKISRKKFTLHSSAAKKLEDYFWPGNVRQLLNVLHRASILCESNKITEDHIILEDARDAANFVGTLKDFEKLLLEKRLKEFEGNKTLTAKSLAVSVRWVQVKCKEYNIEL